MTKKRYFGYTSLRSLLIGVMICTLGFASGGTAQISRTETVDAGTVVQVRTAETINTSNEGEVYSGIVESNVMSRAGRVAIPKGSDVEIVVREISDSDLVLDLDAITINGSRHSLSSQSGVTANRREGVGINKRTGKYVGGGAVLGAIIGAIAGGKKGAAIGAGAGAAAGAGTQILTRGDKIEVPAESLLSFRLTQSLQTSLSASSFNQSRQFETKVNPNSAAYQAGLQAGESDADRNRPRDSRTTRWRSAAERRDYQAGYTEGYESEIDLSTEQRFKPAAASIAIGDDNQIRWNGPEHARVFVQMNEEPRKLFASGATGTQEAPWIKPGNVYVFIVVDANGNEIARDRLDLRSGARRRR